MAANGIKLLRYSIGIIFIWFGGLKFFPGLSPAEGLAMATIERLTLGIAPLYFMQFTLALFEVIIGLLMISGRFIRLTILLLLVQMVGTMSPLILFPELVFTQPPFALTIEGQYIIKNVVVISAAIVIGATARGGGLLPDPQ